MILFLISFRFFAQKRAGRIAAADSDEKNQHTNQSIISYIGHQEYRIALRRIRLRWMRVSPS